MEAKRKKLGIIAGTLAALVLSTATFQAGKMYEARKHINDSVSVRVYQNPQEDGSVENTVNLYGTIGNKSFAYPDIERFIPRNGHQMTRLVNNFLQDPDEKVSKKKEVARKSYESELYAPAYKDNHAMRQPSLCYRANIQYEGVYGTNILTMDITPRK
jgi:hypothetical protein